jgi:hypothetical protein
MQQSRKERCRKFSPVSVVIEEFCSKPGARPEKVLRKLNQLDEIAIVVNFFRCTVLPMYILKEHEV